MQLCEDIVKVNLSNSYSSLSLCAGARGSNLTLQASINELDHPLELVEVDFVVTVNIYLGDHSPHDLVVVVVLSSNENCKFFFFNEAVTVLI